MHDHTDLCLKFVILYMKELANTLFLIFDFRANLLR